MFRPPPSPPTHMMDSLELRFRLRAEEIRALAGQMTVDLNQKALNRTAQDYERLAESAELLATSNRRLASLNATTSDVRWCGTESEKAARSKQKSRSPEHQAQIYRDMAADAVALATVACSPADRG